MVHTCNHFHDVPTVLQVLRTTRTEEGTTICTADIYCIHTFGKTVNNSEIFKICT
jgi:hypothetical protein